MAVLGGGSEEEEEAADCEAGCTGRGRGKALVGVLGTTVVGPVGVGPVANRGTGGRFGVVAGFLANAVSISPVDASCKYEYKESASSPRAPPHKEGLIGD